MLIFMQGGGIYTRCWYLCIHSRLVSILAIVSMLNSLTWLDIHRVHYLE